MSLETVEELKSKIIAFGTVPKHIAFIMDGNGRWAHKRRLPRIAGHNQGVKSVRRMVEVGPEIGVDVMTFYTFSAENWRRPKFEVTALMKLLLDSINRELDDLKQKNVCLKVIGDMQALPEKPRLALEKAVEETGSNSGLKLVLALSYSGRSDIVRAVNRIIEANINEVDENRFTEFLDTSSLPDPELLIRTSGEMRLSNFLLYQLAYTEIVVTDTFWPDFSPDHLYQCIAEYQQRERRFGKTSEQISND